jgi:hypothetical protein
MEKVIMEMSSNSANGTLDFLVVFLVIQCQGSVLNEIHPFGYMAQTETCREAA